VYRLICGCSLRGFYALSIVSGILVSAFAVVLKPSLFKENTQSSKAKGHLQAVDTFAAPVAKSWFTSL
jgi:hypothetical protein